MKTRQYIFLMMVLPAMASAVSLVLTHRYIRNEKPGTAPDVLSNAHRPSVPALISTKQPATHTFISRASWTGIVEGRSSVVLSALTDGRIISVDAVDQSPVRKGAPVFRIGGQRVDEVRARLSNEVMTLEKRLNLSREVVKRAEQNLKEHLSTKDQEAASMDSLLLLEAQLREARLNLKAFENRTAVVAPVDGIFTNRAVSTGQEVNSGQVLGDIVDTRHLRIAASVFCPGSIRLTGKSATVRTDGHHILSGTVRRVLPIADNNGATRIWIEGPDIDKNLRPGRTVSGTLDVSTGAPALSVPESAVVYDPDEQPYLFVTAGTDYEARKVRLGMSEDGQVEVLSGLKSGQEVVTKGAYELYYHRFSTQFKVED